MFKTTLLFCLLLTTSLVSSLSSIIPGVHWFDTNGTLIQAHAAGFLKHEGFFYWFGEDKTENNQKFLNVKCYRSTDLLTWSFVSNALAVQGADSEIGPDAVVERPKVIYNEQTNTFVMWFHLDNSNYQVAKLGVAYSSSIEGPYEFHMGISPFGADSRDMTVWKDEDGKAYAIYATNGNSDTVIASLTSDYLDLEEKVHTFSGVRWEAFAMFKTNGLYYLVTSGLTGWNTNPNHYTYSSSLVNGDWAEAMPIAPDSSNTFNSQSNNVIPVGGGQFIFTGDRWNPSLLGDSRYIWLPIEMSPDNSIKISWRPQWSIDIESGQWGDSGVTYDAADESHVELSGDAYLADCTGCMSGKAVVYVGKGGVVTFVNLTASQTWNYSIVVSYINGDSGNREATVDVNGQRTTLLSFSPTGNLVNQIVFQAQMNQGNNNSISFYNDDEYAPDFDYISVECYDAQC